MVAKSIPYIIGAVVIASVWMHGNYHGKQSIELQYLNDIADHQETIRIMADELTDAQNNREVVVKEVIKNVYTEVDNSGCADSDMLDSVYKSLGGSTD